MHVLSPVTAISHKFIHRSAQLFETIIDIPRTLAHGIATTSIIIDPIIDWKMHLLLFRFRQLIFRLIIKPSTVLVNQIGLSYKPQLTNLIYYRIACLLHIYLLKRVA